MRALHSAAAAPSGFFQAIFGVSGGAAGRLCLCFGGGGGHLCVWPSRRVMFPFLDLNSLPDTSPKGHSVSAGSMAHTDNTSAHGRDRGGANKDGNVKNKLQSITKKQTMHKTPVPITAACFCLTNLIT